MTEYLEPVVRYISWILVWGGVGIVTVLGIWAILFGFSKVANLIMFRLWTLELILRTAAKLWYSTKIPTPKGWHPRRDLLSPKEGDEPTKSPNALRWIECIGHVLLFGARVRTTQPWRSHFRVHPSHWGVSGIVLSGNYEGYTVILDNGEESTFREEELEGLYKGPDAVIFKDERAEGRGFTPPPNLFGESL